MTIELRQIDPEDLDGFVTDITLTDGGAGYSTAPTIAIDPPAPGLGPLRALATAKIVGPVGRVRITNPGSGYIAPPEIAFTAVDGKGSGAAATVEVNAGQVTGVSAVRRQPTGTIAPGAGVVVAVSIATEAPAGTPNGTRTTTITCTSPYPRKETTVIASRMVGNDSSIRAAD